MKMEIDILDYSPNTGIALESNPEAIIETNVSPKSVLIRANRVGLIMFATHLLTLAQSQVPAGSHIHYDDFNFLEKGSQEFIVERI